MGRETNKSRREAQAQSAREKAAAARSQSKQAEQRRRAMVILSTIVVLAIVGGIIAIVAVNNKGTNEAVVSSTPAVAAVMQKVSSVPSATLDAVGVGSAVSGPQAVSGVPAAAKPLTGANGQPQLLYIGAEFCPYCAAERWSMGVALSRFGTLKGTSFTASSGSDVNPNTATLDFKNTTYTSKYLSFAPYEAEDRNQKQLQTVPAAANSLWAALSAKYVASKQRSFPFLDFGNRYVITGPTYLPDVLKGLTQAQIASQLADQTSAVAKGVDGAANIITATLCDLTNNKPATVCSSSTITNIQTQIAQGQNGNTTQGSGS